MGAMVRRRLKRLISIPAIPSWIVIIWKIAEQVDSIMGVFERAQTVLGFLSSPLVSNILLLIGLAVLAWLVLKPESKKNTLSDEQLANQMKAELRKDSDEFARSLFIHNPAFNWSPLLNTDPYFTVDFYIYSSSIYRLNIGDKYEGNMCYVVEPMEPRVEVEKPIKDLARSSTDFIRLRQWVSPARMRQIRLDRGQISLNFSHVNIRVEGKLPGQDVSINGRLSLPNQLDEMIPIIDKLNSQSSSDKGDSQKQ